MATGDWWYRIDDEWVLLTPHATTGYPSIDQPPPAEGGGSFHDQMSRYPNGTASGTSASGHQWAVFQSGTVVSGLFDSTGTSAAYLETDISAQPNRVGCEFKFDNEGGAKTTSGTLALITWADGGIVANGFGRRTAMHVTLTQNAVQWYVREVVNGGAVTLLSTRTISPAIPSNVFITAEASIDFDTNTGTVTLSDGRSFSWTDPRIARRTGETFACWEPYYGGSATATRVKVARTWAEPVAPS